MFSFQQSQFLGKMPSLFYFSFTVLVEGKRFPFLPVIFITIVSNIASML